MLRGMLLDLDDTILDDSSMVDVCWEQACVEHGSGLLVEPGDLHGVIRKMSAWFWGDADRHRTGRLNLDAAREEVVALALWEVGIDDRPLAAKIAESYGRRREAGMVLLPEAKETVQWLRSRRLRLGLLTNGASEPQRRKLSRFGLSDLFDTILIEGEVGFGKPDPRVYRLALERLELDAGEVWMVGDNLEWDVVAAQKLG